MLHSDSNENAYCCIPGERTRMPSLPEFLLFAARNSHKELVDQGSDVNGNKNLPEWEKNEW